MGEAVERQPRRTVSAWAFPAEDGHRGARDWDRDIRQTADYGFDKN